MKKSFFWAVAVAIVLSACGKNSDSGSQSAMPANESSEKESALASAKDCSPQIAKDYAEIEEFCAGKRLRSCDFAKHSFFIKNPDAFCKYKNGEKIVNVFDPNKFPSARAKSSRECTVLEASDFKNCIQQCKADFSSCGFLGAWFWANHDGLECYYKEGSSKFYILTDNRNERDVGSSSSSATETMCDTRSKDIEHIRQNAKETHDKAIRAGFGNGLPTNSKYLKASLRSFESKYATTKCPGISNDNFIVEINRTIDEIDNLTR